MAVQCVKQIGFIRLKIQLPCLVLTIMWGLGWTETCKGGTSTYALVLATVVFASTVEFTVLAPQRLKKFGTEQGLTFWSILSVQLARVVAEQKAWPFASQLYKEITTIDAFHSTIDRQAEGNKQSANFTSSAIDPFPPIIDIYLLQLSSGPSCWINLPSLVGSFYNYHLSLLYPPVYRP